MGSELVLGLETAEFQADHNMVPVARELIIIHSWLAEKEVLVAEAAIAIIKSDGNQSSASFHSIDLKVSLRNHKIKT